MKKSLFFAVLFVFFFSSSAYSACWQGERLVLDDTGMWVTGYPTTTVVNSKEIKTTKAASSQKKEQKQEPKKNTSKKSLTKDELLQQEESRRVHGLDYQVW